VVKLIVGNSYSKVEGLDLNQLKELRKLCSYQIDKKAAYFSGSIHNLTRHLMDKKGGFPSGLLHLVKQYLLSVVHEVEDNRRVPEPRQGLFTLSLPSSPYPQQKDAIEAANSSNGIISMVTGFGKSWAMAMLIAAKRVKTLVIVPNLGLKTQLKETFLNIFGSLDNITIENIDSPALETAKDYNMLIIDEAHHAAASTYRRLNKTAWSGIYYRYFFTATPFRSRDEETILMESITGGVIYEVTYQQAVESKAIVPVEAYYIEVPKIETDAYTWSQVYSQLVVNNAKRNEIIATLLVKLSMAKVPALCLVKEISHGEELSCGGAFPFANGKDEDTPIMVDHFNKGAHKTLIGTTGVLGEGVDTKPAEYVIIAGLGKSKNQFMQQVGRGVRNYPGKESCKVIIFLDKSHKFTLRHFREQKRFLLDEYGVIPVKLEL
jgi:superfamily II DNA or RNA helicase